MNKYRSTRDYENLQRAMFEGVGEYGIPILRPDDPDVDNWIGFNYALGCEEPEIHGVHFFVDDYQFVRLWKRPEAYAEKLAQFQAVCTPDFSTYTDFPKAVQVYNHYRKHSLGAYWQQHMVRVIPTISWSDRESYTWCFDGEPDGGMVAVSTVGTQNSRETRRMFLEGYNEMLARLQPSRVLMYGMVPDECQGNIIPVRAFQQRLKAYDK